MQEKSVYDDSYGNKQAARVQGSAASFCRRDEFDLRKINYQVIARTTPPSARSAVPLIAEDSGLARKITKGSYFVGASETFEQRARANSGEKLFLEMRLFDASGVCDLIDELFHTLGASRTCQNRIHGHCCPRRRLGKSARQDLVRSLRGRHQDEAGQRQRAIPAMGGPHGAGRCRIITL